LRLKIITQSINQRPLIGEGKSYLVALITLNQLGAEAYARAQGIEYEVRRPRSRLSA
jgi:hypothetical protein